MIETTVKVDGMMCGMCEAHVSDAIRGALPVKKVTASHTKGQAVILSEAPLDEEALRAAIGKTGYEVQGVSARPYEKKGDRKSTRLNSSHTDSPRMPSSA